MPYLCLVQTNVVNNMKVLSFAMETQQWASSAFLSIYKIFNTAINDINVLRSSQSARYLIPSQRKLNFFKQIFIKVSNSKSHKIRPVAAQFIHAGRKADMTKPKRA